MLRKYSIHEKYSDMKDAVAYLYYDESTRKYSMDIICKNLSVPMPAILYILASQGRYHVDDDIARLYVKEHVIPSDRAGIGYILKKLRFPYYDEIFFLDKFQGRSVMDEFICERVV